MLPIFSLSPSQIAGFFLIFVRIGAIMFTAPIFSSPRVPVQLRTGICLLLTFLLQPVVAPDGPQVNFSLIVFGALLLREVIVGLVIGYIANLLFSAIEMAGELQDTQSGFGFAGVVDPNFERSSAILGQFQMVLMWLIFMTVNGHHLLMQAIADSFQLVPLGKFAYHEGLTTQMLRLVTNLLLIAIRISAPVLGSVLLADLGMGVLQRTAPQLNIMAVGFQVKIVVAVIVVGLALPFICALQRDVVFQMAPAVRDMLSAR